MAKGSDYSNQNKKKRFLDSEIRKISNVVGNFSREVETYLGGPYGAKRQKALLNYMDRAEKDFKTFGLAAGFDSYARMELIPINDYNHLDDDYDIRIGAALWILDHLRASGKLGIAYSMLPTMDADSWYLPPGFFHPCYAEDLIQSVIYLLTYRYDLFTQRTAENKEQRRSSGVIITPENASDLPPGDIYLELIKLLPVSEIDRACEAFRNKVWELATRRMKAQGCFDRQIEGTELLISSRTNGLISSNVGQLLGKETLPVNPQGVMQALKNVPKSDRVWEAARRSQEVLEKNKDFTFHFDEYLQMDRRTIAKRTGIREVAAALDGFTVEDPYAMCFALFRLMDTGDDAPWLMRSGTALMLYALNMLPWHEIQDNWTDEEWEDWYEERPYNYNGWKDRDPVADQIDYLHEKHDGRNLGQIIYGLSRGVVPIGMHPFDQERKQLIEEGMEEEKARKVTETADLLFLMSYQAHHRGTDYSLLDEEDDEKTIWETVSSEAAGNGALPGKTGGQRTANRTPNAGDAENEEDVIDPATENERLKQELDSLKKQLKSVKNTLALTMQESNQERTRLERELKTLRMEHRELADLRELVFNREADNQEKLEKVTTQYDYPYETRKRTVVFGGHDSFLRAFRPMFTNVRFVDAGYMSYNPDIIRNADVVWIQNNCISHPQYWSIVKNCKQSGVQMRYFGFASAEKCAEQLVTEDLKE